MSYCAPCAWQNKLSPPKQERIRNEAKNTAIEKNTYQAIIFNIEDSDFDIVDLEQVKVENLWLAVIDILSPHQRIAT
jgi:hypothetical protein